MSVPADVTFEELADIEALITGPTKYKPNAQNQKLSDLGMVNMLTGGGGARGRAGTLMYGQAQKERELGMEQEQQSRLKLAAMGAAEKKAREDRALRQELADESIAARKEIAGIAAGARSDSQSAAAETRRYKEADRLRVEFDKLSAPQRGALEAADSIMAFSPARLGRVPNAQEQQALIIQLNKVLDPTSVVREAEFARTAAGMGLIQKLSNYANRIANGEILSPAAINDVLGVAATLRQQAAAEMERKASYYNDLATRRGYDPMDVTGMSVRGREAPQPGAAQAPATQGPAGNSPAPTVRKIR